MIFKKATLTSCILCALLIPFSYADEISDIGETTKEVQVDKSSKDAIGRILLQSISLIGIPYHWGGNTPQQGMDCSGFIRYVFKESLGINLPRTASEMSKIGKRISLDQLEPGDLLFFNTRRGSNTHVGMYIGNNKFIQSPRTGQNIQISDLDSSWKSKINGAKRIVQENEDSFGKTIVESYHEIDNEALPSKPRYTKKHSISSRKRSHRAKHGKHSSKSNIKTKLSIKNKMIAKSKTKGKISKKSFKKSSKKKN